MTTFADFGLSAPILKALAGEGYTNPTPIQAQAIPTVLLGRDILGIAQTGTGKTAAFALPILDQLSRNPRQPSQRGCRALVLAPTRELASQIADSFKVYGRQLRMSIVTVFGGVSISRQERNMAPGVDILVATPGRLIDLIDRRSLTLHDLEILVLDEADQMLDLGFIHALKRIVTLLPKKRQSLFFSATMPKTISGLADSFLTDPVKVAVAPVASTAERVEQSVMFVPQQKKQAVLNKVLEDASIERTLIFSRTKHGADRIVRNLEAAGHVCSAIHGNKSQAQRERALKAFRDGRMRILVATDIAARGIDVEAVSHVINYDLPNVPESYVHRIGRTARAGAEGIAISFCADDERPFLRDIERLTRQRVFVTPIPEGVDFSVRPVPAPPEEMNDDRRGNFRNGPRGGQGRPGDNRSQRPAFDRGPRQDRGDRQDRPARAPEGNRFEALLDLPRPADRDERRPARSNDARPPRPEGERNFGPRPNRNGPARGHGGPARDGNRDRSDRGPSQGARHERPASHRSERPAGERPARGGHRSRD